MLRHSEAFVQALRIQCKRNPSFQVCWANEAAPEQGLRYLYLSDEDYHSYTAECSTGALPFAATEVPAAAGAPRHWRLTDVVGAEDGLGVECLSGSGAIAAAFARAFNEGFTATLVSGRTVGIGAYLARLGRRCEPSSAPKSGTKQMSCDSAVAHDATLPCQYTCKVRI